MPFDCSDDQFNPAVCIVSLSSIHLRANIWIHRQNGSVCRINILDTILVAGGYLKRFPSTGIETRKRDIPPNSRQYTQSFGCYPFSNMRGEVLTNAHFTQTGRLV